MPGLVVKLGDSEREDDEDKAYSKEQLEEIGDCLREYEDAKTSGDWTKAARYFCYAVELHQAAQREKRGY